MATLRDISPLLLRRYHSGQGTCTPLDSLSLQDAGKWASRTLHVLTGLGLFDCRNWNF